MHIRLLEGSPLPTLPGGGGQEVDVDGGATGCAAPRLAGRSSRDLAVVLEY